MAIPSNEPDSHPEDRESWRHELSIAQRKLNVPDFWAIASVFRKTLGIETIVAATEVEADRDYCKKRRFVLDQFLFWLQRGQN